jgi:glutathione S-transferase
MPTLVIGNKNYSSWSLRPWLLLRQFGVRFDERRLVLDTQEFREQIGQWSPSGRVPALDDDGPQGEGLIVWDSLAICEYANERWLDGRGWPRDIAVRAQARSAAAEMHSGFAALRAQLPLNCVRTPNAYRWDADGQADIDRVQALWRQMRLRHGRGGDDGFLCGAFGIVDAMFAPVAIRFRGYGVAVDDVGEAYCDALFALPALQEWIAAARAESERLPKYEKHA